MNATSKFLMEVEEHCVLNTKTGHTAMWCAYCRGKRHFTKRCPKLKKRPLLCWNCGERNHRMAQCPQPRVTACNHNGPCLVVAEGSKSNIPDLDISLIRQNLVRNLEEEFQTTYDDLQPTEELLTLEKYGEKAIVDLVELEEREQLLFEKHGEFAIRALVDMDEKHEKKEIIFYLGEEGEESLGNLLEYEEVATETMWQDLEDEVEWMEENRRRCGITFWDHLISRYRKRYSEIPGSAKLSYTDWDVMIMRIRTSLAAARKRHNYEQTI